MLNKGPEKLLFSFGFHRSKVPMGNSYYYEIFKTNLFIFLVKQLDFEDAKQAAQINFEQPFLFIFLVRFYSPSIAFSFSASFKL